MGEVRVMFRALHAAKGRRSKWRLRCYAVAVVAAVAAAPYALSETYRAVLRWDPEWRFVEEVLLRRASGGEQPIVVRWAAPPRIALVDATAEDEAFVRTLVTSLDELFDGSGVSLRLVEPSKSNFQVYFATRDKFDRLAVNLGADPDPSGTGFYLIWPSESFDITAAVAVVGAELTAAERQAAILHQLAHALGLRGDTAVFPESAVFSEADRRSTVTSLSPIDRKLLRLLYINLEPANGWSELRTAFRRYWETL